MSSTHTPTFKAWWDLHAWAGVIASLLPREFFLGVWTLFFQLMAWQEPRGPVPYLASRRT